jgi:hypothetical protein
VTERYRKRGRAVRRENRFLIRVDEAGEAIDDGTIFRVRSLDEHPPPPDPDEQNVERTARAIQSLIEPPLKIERLIVSEGVAEHECDGIHWSEAARRVHLSIARPPLRAIVDAADFSLAAIPRIADALRRAGGERPAPRHLRLAEHVGAALLPSMVAAEGVEIFQSSAPHDGRGQPIETCRVTATAPPNWFRPTYRLRPVRAWFHLRVGTTGREIDRDTPEAVALLAPISGRTLRVLCVDGTRVYAATVEVTRILDAVATSTWYPYAAGSFGAEMML